MHVPSLPAARAPRHGTTPTPPGLLAWLLRFDALYRQRRQLRRLDARMLWDIGLERQAAEAEASRPLWDMPMHQR